MSLENIATITKMMESLPEATQNHIIEHLREYLAELEEEKEWDFLVNKTQHKLTDIARKIKQEITEGKAQLMDYEQL